MSGFDVFLTHYGLVAVFSIMLIKTIGVPIPIPDDLFILTEAVRVAQGKLVGWQVFFAILVALLLGGLIQFVLARGPSRGLLSRFGRYVGLTPRIDAAAEKISKGGVPGLAVSILVPGVRGVAIVASGLADLPLRSFLLGLALGSLLFLSLHFFLGYLGGAALFVLARGVPLSTSIPLVRGLLVVVYALWVMAVRLQKAARAELEAMQTEQNTAVTLEALHEGICPVCLAFSTASQLRSLTTDQTLLEYAW